MEHWRSHFCCQRCICTCICIAFEIFVQRRAGPQVRTASKQILTSTLCDATFWLGVDGEIVLRSDDRFDSLVGRSMLGESLQTCLPGADELVRLQQVLSQARSDDELASASLLPSTLTNTNGSFSVDMCIVSLKQGAPSKSGQGDQNPDPVHLVGVRLMQQAPLAPPAMEDHAGRSGSPKRKNRRNLIFRFSLIFYS